MIPSSGRTRFSRSPSSISGPRSPPPPADLSWSPRWIETGGHLYLALVEAGTHEHQLRIYNADTCRHATSSCSLGELLYRDPLPPSSAAHYLSLSQSLGTPYLYLGGAWFNLQGPSWERLLDLSALRPTGLQTLPALTDLGASLFDPCAGEPVDYFGWYYPRNASGLRNLVPRRAIFAGGTYLYRAAYGALDIHQRTQTDPSILVDVGDGAAWQGQPTQIGLDIASCPDPQPIAWSHDDPLSEPIVATSTLIEPAFALCPDAHCPERIIEISATSPSCPEALHLSGTLALVDPRVHVDGIDLGPSAPGGTIPRCATLEAAPIVSGQSPIDSHWTLTDGPLLVAEGQGPTFTWRAETGTGASIFADGFESGSTAAWGGPAPPSAAPLTLAVTATNLGGSAVSRAATAVTVEALPDLRFADPAIVVFENEGLAIVTVNDTGSERRVFFEDPNGGSTSCPEPITRCTLIPWSTETTFEYLWSEEGLYRVVAEIRQCQSPPVLSSTVSVQVETTSLDPPTLHFFEIDPFQTQGCEDLCGLFSTECACDLGASVAFVVIASATERIRFDWDGNGSWDEVLLETDLVTHVYSSSGSFRPRAQPIRGSVEGDVVDLPFTLVVSNQP